MKVLVTGVAGFIGYFVAQRLLADGEVVCGIDNLNDYYDVSLKQGRLDQLLPHASFSFFPLDLADRAKVEALFQEQSFDRVIHLAAQAGVRYSLKNPYAYADSNLTGFIHILEGCRHTGVEHLVYASSSSVYGANRKVPFSTVDNVDHPVSLYAATKKANELMAHSYSHLYNLPTTGLRFFTVYGPWGRPDMAYFKFVDAIANDRPIQVYNHGKMQRDFTYIDDVVEGVVRTVWHLPKPITDEAFSTAAPYKVYNIGNHSPVELMRFIEIIEQAMGKPAVKEMMPMQPGDVTSTYADVADLTADVGFAPSTPLEVGITKFVDWYKNYYGY
ncbi:NAD-dependent epimerase [Leptolyngbya sp. Heron Island J]|uniref:NAD-dependent epimerase n=1 Tax=Leptolyngbya sp. Heron Island J TaxID=1385935 RepID=UPI000410BCEA|nr:NAD-dependent epimerase [Leptolyngbya sp. Heron Island J]